MNTRPHPKMVKKTVPPLFSAAALLALGLGATALADVRPESGEEATPGAAEGAAASGFQPKQYGVSRYNKIWGKSPFDFEVVVNEEVVEETAATEDLVLAGYSRRGDVLYVTFYDKKNPKGDRIRLTSGERDEDNGILLLDIEKGATYKETRAKVEVGGDIEYVGYDEKKLSQKPTGAVGMAKTAGRPQTGSSRNRQGRAGQPNPAAGNRQNQQGGGNARPGQPGQQQGSAPNPAAAAAAGGGNAAQATTQDASAKRNEVIQRLLDRARQQKNAGAQAGGGSGNQGGSRRRRVVLPPPK